MKQLLPLVSLLLACALQAQSLQLAIQRGHKSAVTCLAASSDQEFFLSGSKDKSIKLWEVATGREVYTYQGQQGFVFALALHPEQNRFVSGSGLGEVWLWDIDQNEVLIKYEGLTDKVTSLAFSPDGKWLVGGGYDFHALVWDAVTGAVADTLKVNPDKGTGYGVSINFSADGSMLIIGEDNYTVSLYEMEESPVLRQRYTTRKNAWCGGCPARGKLHPDGDNLVMVSRRAPLQLQPLDTSKLSLSLSAEFESLESWAFDLDEEMVYIAQPDTISAFSFAARNRQWIYVSPDHQIFSLAALGDQLLAGREDGSIVQLNMSAGKETTIYQGTEQLKKQGGLAYDPESYWEYYIAKYLQLKRPFAIDPSGQLLALARTGSSVKIWDLASGRIAQELFGHTREVTAVCFSPDGSRLATGSDDQTIRIWDAATGAQQFVLKGHRAVIFDLEFSSDGNTLISAAFDETARIWDANQGELIRSYVMEANSPYDIRFVQNDLYFLASGLGKKMQLFERDTGLPVRDYIGHTDVIADLATMDGQQKFISVGWDGYIKQWDLSTGLQVRKLNRHEGPVYASAWNAGQQLLATGGFDRKIALGNPDRPGEVRLLEGHQQPVVHLSFTPDGSRLVSASSDGMIIFWEISSGEMLLQFMSIGSNDWLAATPKGYFDATQGAREVIFFANQRKTYALEQFFEKFYQPGLFHQALERKQSSLEENALDRLAASPPPSIIIESPRPGEPIRAAKIDVQVKITSQGGGISEIKCLHNGKRIPVTIPGLDRIQKQGRSVSLFIPIELVPGANEIKLSGFSADRIESIPVSRTYYWEGEPVTTRVFALAVGINSYKNPALNLNYARHDAEAFVKAVRDQKDRLFQDVQVMTLYDDEATRENILYHLQIIAAEANPNDVFIFYYAGHGAMVDDSFYFVPTENTRLYDRGQLNRSALYAGDLQESLKQIRALKQVLVIDACQSGGSAELLATRGANEEKAIAQLSRSAGVHVLASAGSEQVASEFASIGHGIFTYVLLDALNGAADGAPADTKITVYELKSYLDDRVPALSQEYKGRPQYPNTFSRGNDFPIAISGGD